MTEEEKEFERELALSRHNAAKNKPASQTGGVVGQVGGVFNEGAKAAEETYQKASRASSWAKAAYATTARKAAKVWSWLDPIAEPIIRAGIWTAPKLAHFAGNSFVAMSCKKDKDGYPHFNAWHLAKNLVKVGVVMTASPIIASGSYYYATWDTYKDIYIPNAGVFVNQQFVHPSKAGQVMAPRDEVFTILGKEVDKNGKITPIRFDLDSNMFFFFYKDAWRPDLAAAKLDSQSPYGVRCTLEATGFYTRLPRYDRIWAMKWMDLRPEVVRVVGCQELDKLPEVFKSSSNKESVQIEPQKPANQSYDPYAFPRALEH